MKRLVLIAMLLLGTIVGGAAAAFVATTSNTGNSFTTRAIASQPVIGTTRITTDPACAAGVPVETVRQNAAFYVCVSAITDAAGIASATADVSTVATGKTAVPLTTTGGPFGTFAYRSAAITADTPLLTGSSGIWSVQATNTTGDRTSAPGLTINIRSYFGDLLTEFGTTAVPTPVHYYRLDQATAATAAPNVGTGGAANGTYAGTPTMKVPGALVGDSDQAVRFNGTTDYMSFARKAAIGTNFSVEFWVKGNASSGAGPGTLFSDSAGLVDAGNTANATDFGVALDTTGRIVAGCGNGGVVRSGAGALSDGNWHHVVFTRTAASKVITLFVDGTNVASNATCSNVALTGSTTVWIGRSHESSLYATATIDDVALYSSVLTAAQITDHNKVGAGLP